jgi:hypothetical protein
MDADGLVIIAPSTLGLPDSHRECGSVSIVMHAGVPGGKRRMVMRSQTTAVLANCQLFFSGHKLEDRTAHEKLLLLEDKV